MGWAVEQADGVFAIVAADLAELVQDASSQWFGGFLVAEINCSEIIPFGLPTHEIVTLLAGCYCLASVGYILIESTISPWVTF